jgi:hypothetical protein
VADRRGGIPAVLTVLLGAVAGFFVGFLVGSFVGRWVAATGGTDGWEDLVAVVVSLISFGPVGAIVGGVLGAQRNGRWLWSDVSPRRRRSTLVGAAGSSLVALVLGTIWMEAMSGMFLAVWAFPIGGLVGWIVGRDTRIAPAGDGGAI